MVGVPNDVATHRPPHIADSDETDPHGFIPLTLPILMPANRDGRIVPPCG